MLCNTRRSLVDLMARLKENGSACVFMKHDLFCTAAPRLPFLSFTKVKREMKRYKRKSEYKVMSQHQYVNSGGQPRYKKNEWYLSACTGGHRVVKVTVSQQRNRLGLTGRLLPFVLFSPFFSFFFLLWLQCKLLHRRFRRRVFVCILSGQFPHSVSSPSAAV